MKKILVLAATAALAMGSFTVQANPYNALGCAGCHGPNGKSSIPTYPSLAGKDAASIVKALKDFQSGARKDPTMSAMAPMAAGQEQAIADFLAAQ